MRSRSSRRRTAAIRESTSSRSWSSSARTSGALGARPAAASAMTSRPWVFSASSRASCSVDGLDAALDEGELRLRIRGRLAETGPAHRIAPRRADCRGALVPRAGRAALAAELVAGVVPPQAAVVAHPRGVVVDDDDVPLELLLRPDARAVAARVVDVGDAQARALRGARPRSEDLRDAPDRRHDAAEPRRHHGDQVVAGEVGARVRSGAREDDRMASVDEGQVGIVPAPAQVVADLVVRGEDDPARQRQAVARPRARSRRGRSSPAPSPPRAR